jgi:hypothetical protein
VAVATDIGAQPADFFAVAADAGLVLMNKSTAGMMPAIKGEAALVLFKLPLNVLQLLLVSPQVAR